MPTVLRIGPYRFYFFSHETNEPPHIHVDESSSTTNFWLSPVQLSRAVGFSAQEVRAIQKLVVENEQVLLEAWNGYFS